jgi:hypothetical protein
MITLDEERLNIIADAYNQRRREVMHHQINIDNYTRAIAEIEANHTDKAHMVEFLERLRDLLASSIVEQDKERVLLKVIGDQLGG